MIERAALEACVEAAVNPRSPRQGDADIADIMLAFGEVQVAIGGSSGGKRGGQIGIRRRQGAIAGRGGGGGEIDGERIGLVGAVNAVAVSVFEMRIRQVDGAAGG